MPDERDARLAENEARFRAINERVERDLSDVVTAEDELLPFICECAQRSCAATIELTVAEYEHVRSEPILFAVSPGHEIPDIEDVVAHNDRFTTIRKHAATHPIVQRMDPRGGNGGSG
jgi:hypothetical protein